MKASLRALVAGSIDYAGCFPPASLPVEQAWDRFVRYQSQPNAWLLGRFVCRAADVGCLAKLRGPAANVRVSAVGHGADHVGEVLSALAGDLSSVLEGVEAFELRLPSDVSGPAMAQLLPPLIEQLRQASESVRTLFLEVPWTSDSSRFVEQVAAEVAALKQKMPLNIGLKFRTGGETATAFPSPAQLAAAIVHCRLAGLPWKATAGLHGAFGGADRALGVWRFGFLNLLSAAVLVWVHELKEDLVCELLQSEELVFDSQRLVWRELSATIDHITAARTGSMVSFGSCSFEEPCAALGTLTAR